MYEGKLHHLVNLMPLQKLIHSVTCYGILNLLCSFSFCLTFLKRILRNFLLCFRTRHGLFGEREEQTARRGEKIERNVHNKKKFNERLLSFSCVRHLQQANVFLL